MYFCTVYLQPYIVKYVANTFQDSDSQEDLEALEKRLRERALQSIQSKEEMERELQLREKALKSMKRRSGSDSSEEDSD